MITRATLFAIFIVSTSAPSYASESFESKAITACASLNQETCWVKPGTIICREAPASCSTIYDSEPMQLIEFDGKQAKIRVATGVGMIPKSAVTISDRGD